MKPRELAVWSAPGETPRSGVVIDRGKPGSRKALIEWDDGERAHVQKKDPAIRFVPEGSALAEWAMNPGDLEDLLAKDPAEVFRRYLQEQPESVTQGTLTKMLVSLGFTVGEARAAWERAKPALRSDSHIAAYGVRYQWSDEPIDPLSKFRSLSPEDALQRLLQGRLKVEEKAALADAIRAGFNG